MKAGLSFVGYTRVSSARQEEEGFSLDVQAQLIRTWAKEAGRTQAMIFSDSTSARGSRSIGRRAALQDAIKMAAEQGLDLVVPSISRLGRDVAVIQSLEQSGVSVISIAEGGRKVTRATLRALVERAQSEVAIISRRTRESLQIAKARGVLLGNCTNLSAAQRRGSIQNVVRADIKVKELADFLEVTPGWNQLKHGELVDLLNASGRLNLVKESTPERKPWTYSSLRKPLLAAIKELALRREVDAEEIEVGSDTDFPDKQSQSRPAALLEAEVKAMKLEHDFEDDPRFGAF